MDVPPWIAYWMSHSQAPLPRDKPRYLPFPCIKPKSPPEFPNLYFRRFLSRICESRYQIIVHKILSWINSWQQKKTFTHQNRFGSPGLSVPDERMCSPRPEPTQCSLTNLSRGAYSTKSAWNDQSPTQRGFPAVITNTLVCKKHQGVQQLDNRTLGSSFTADWHHQSSLPDAF